MSVMFQFAHDPAEGTPTLADVARRFDLPEAAFDADYGVVLVDERAGLWVALVDDEAAATIQAALAAEDTARGEGVFANPRIEPTDLTDAEPTDL